ncbi:MAG: CHAT domain-containing protein [Bacteroidota bacterium]
MRFLPFLFFCLLQLPLWGQSADALYEQALTQVAQKDYLQADKILNELIDRYPNRRYDLASAYLLKSQIALQLNVYESARNFNGESLAIREALGSDDLASNLHQDARIYVAQGHLAKAIQVWDAAENLPFESAELITQIYLDKSEVFLRLGKAALALDYADQAQAIMEIEGVEEERTLIRSYWQKARANLALGEEGKAKALLTKASAYADSKGEAEQLLVARCLVLLGNLQEEPLQVKHLLHALEIIDPLLKEKNMAAVEVLLDIANSYPMIDELSGKSIDYEATGALLPISETNYNDPAVKEPKPTSLLLFARATAFKASKTKDETLFELAVKTLELHLSYFPQAAVALLQNSSSSWEEIFTKAIQLYAEKEQTKEALAYASRWKFFRQSLCNTALSEAELGEGYKELAFQYAQYQATPLNSVYANKAAERLKALPRKTSDFGFDLRNLQANIPNKQAILLYAGDGQQYWGFAIHKGGVVMHALNIEDLIPFDSLLHQSDTDRYQMGAHAWYEALVEPFLAELEAIEHLHIVPEVTMGFIPFEALVHKVRKGASFRKLNYLLEDYQISYGLNLPAQLEQKPVPKVGIQLFAPSVTAAQLPADVAPLYDTTYQLYPALYEKLARPNALSDRINQTLINRFDRKNQSITTLFGEAATVEALHEASTSEKILHFGGPVISVGGAEQAVGALASAGEGVLELDRIYRSAWNWSNQLISFSDLHMPASFEASEPLLNAFFSGRATQLLVPFEAGAANALLDQFYKRMLKGKTPEAALVRAKQKLIQNKRTAAPKHWAGYLLFK